MSILFCIFSIAAKPVYFPPSHNASDLCYPQLSGHAQGYSRKVSGDPCHIGKYLRVEVFGKVGRENGAKLLHIVKTDVSDQGNGYALRFDRLLKRLSAILRPEVQTVLVAGN